MIKTSMVLILATLTLASTACTRGEDPAARNMSVPERSESTTADVDRRDEGMTGATNTTDQNDESAMHSNRREAARSGEKNKGLSTSSETTESGVTGTTSPGTAAGSAAGTGAPVEGTKSETTQGE